MMLDLVLRQLGRRKGRAALTIAGIAIGILLVATLSSFSEGINSIIGSELALLSGKITITAEGISFQNYQASEIDDFILEELEGLSGVEAATGIVIGSVPGVGDIYGIRMSDVELLNLDVDAKEGRFPEEGVDELALGIFYSENSGLRTGDEITVRGKKYPIIGVMGETGTEEDYGIVTSFEPAQEILRKEGKVTIIIVTPVIVENVESLAREIETMYDELSVMTDKDAAREAEKFTGQLSALTFAVGSIAALIAGLGIMNVMFMSVRERRREIGVMKALGATTNEILGQVMLEAITITLIGEIIGLVLSFGAVAAINSVSGQVSAVITPGLLINITIFALSLAIVSGLLPAREAARLQPAVVLRYE
jgi:putative ABC transport system permease protein